MTAIISPEPTLYRFTADEFERMLQLGSIPAQPSLSCTAKEKQRDRLG